MKLTGEFLCHSGVPAGLTRRFARDNGNSFIKEPPLLSESLFLDCIAKGSIVHCQHKSSQKYLILCGQQILCESTQPVLLSDTQNCPNESVIGALLVALPGCLRVYVIKKHKPIWNGLARNKIDSPALRSLRDGIGALSQLSADYYCRSVGQFDLFASHCTREDWVTLHKHLQSPDLDLSLADGKYGSLFSDIYTTLQGLADASGGRLEAVCRELLILLSEHRHHWRDLCSFIRETLGAAPLASGDDEQRYNNDPTRPPETDPYKKTPSYRWEDAVSMETVNQVSEVTKSELTESWLLRTRPFLDLLRPEKGHQEAQILKFSEIPNDRGRAVDFRFEPKIDGSGEYIILLEGGTVFRSNEVTKNFSDCSSRCFILGHDQIIDFENGLLRRISDDTTIKLPDLCVQASATRKTLLCFSEPSVEGCTATSRNGEFKIYAFE